MEMHTATHKSDTERHTRKKVAYVSVLVLVIILISVIVASLVHRKILADSSGGDAPWHRPRLPKSLAPFHYRLELKPNLEEFLFTGAVEISLHCLAPTRYIVLHANLLNITEGSVFLKSLRGEILTLRDRFLYPKNEFLVLESKTSLETDRRYVIGMKFQGKLLEDMRGFYRSFYSANSTHNDRRYLAVSQFAPMDARKAFPCFDEPAMKATFDVTLVHQSEYTALSNMPIRQSEKRSEGWVADHFYTTLCMPTYLLAFVIADFSYKEGVTGCVFGALIASPRPVHQAVPVGVLRYYRDGMLGDLICPNTIVLGRANQSLVKYTPGNLAEVGGKSSCGPDENHPYHLRVWARGNAVTAGEVDYALGVAMRVLTYYENSFGIAYPLPKLDIVAAPQMRVPAMENLGLVVSHENRLIYAPKLSPTWKKEEVASMIAHELAHMWFGNLVTPEWWGGVWLKEGLATWAAVMGVDAAEPAWRVKERYFVQSLHQILPVDSSSLSHPLQLTVTGPQDVTRQGSSLMRMLNTILGTAFRKGILKYLQKYKYSNAGQNDLWACLTEAVQEDGRTDVQVKEVMDTWTLQMGFPVVTVTRDYSNGRVTATQRHFLYDPEVNVPDSLRKGFPSLRRCEFVVTGKHHQTGYYRVNYDVNNWQLLAEDLDTANFQNIPTQSRAGLIDDAFNLVRSGHLAPEVALNLSRYLTREREYLPWLAAERAFGYLHMMLANSNSSSDLKVYVKSLVTPVYQELGWKNTGDHTTNVEPNLKAVILQYGSDRTGAGLVAAILNRTRSLVDSGLFTKADLLNKLTTLVNTKEEKKLVFNFLKNNWDYMMEGSSAPPGLISKLTEEFTTHDNLLEFEEFLTGHPDMSSDSDVTKSLERIRQTSCGETGTRTPSGSGWSRRDLGGDEKKAT
ncbi:Endoplasmic reticulum aminopeptidase 1 [Branchiostoma belcheri]|nr:Endoplasmic reticulum aminopeptidase 1 [Branchiostoma belcheri]